MTFAFVPYLFCFFWIRGYTESSMTLYMPVREGEDVGVMQSLWRKPEKPGAENRRTWRVTHI